jgi:hypothetical protein
MLKLINCFNAAPTLANAARLIAYDKKHPFACLTLRDSDRLSLAAAKAIL